MVQRRSWLCSRYTATPTCRLSASAAPTCGRNADPSGWNHPPRGGTFRLCTLWYICQGTKLRFLHHLPRTMLVAGKHRVGTTLLHASGGFVRNQNNKKKKPHSTIKQ